MLFICCVHPSVSIVLWAEDCQTQSYISKHPRRDLQAAAGGGPRARSHDIKGEDLPGQWGPHPHPPGHHRQHRRQGLQRQGDQFRAGLGEFTINGERSRWPMDYPLQIWRQRRGLDQPIDGQCTAHYWYGVRGEATISSCMIPKDSTAQFLIIVSKEARVQVKQHSAGPWRSASPTSSWSTQLPESRHPERVSALSGSVWVSKTHCTLNKIARLYSFMNKMLINLRWKKNMGPSPLIGLECSGSVMTMRTCVTTTEMAAWNIPSLHG